MNYTDRLTAAAVALALATSCGGDPEPPSIEIWHGFDQSVGAVGVGQPDFNLMGVMTGSEFTYRYLGNDPVDLVTGEGKWGFRRLGSQGHFNLEIPVELIDDNGLWVELTASDGYTKVTRTATVRHQRGEPAALPFAIDWSSVESIQDVGQIVDGKWARTERGLLSEEPLYDRLFLIGNPAWTDYDVKTTVTVHAVPDKNGPKSGGSGVGFIPRFLGHTVSPPRFPEATPKWGYQPFGAICWLRWDKDDPSAAPVRQFYRGDRDASESFAALDSFAVDTTFGMRMRCTTDPDDPSTTTYRLRVWLAETNEPEGWDFEVTQTSEEANRNGGVALVAHHVSVTFGDVTVE